MTMDDDPKLELLERDLRQLAAAREDDEAVRLALRAQLADRLRPRRRRRLATRIAVGSCVAAAAAIAIVALVGTGTPSGPTAADAAVIHHALAAVSPPANKILYVKVVGVQNGVSVAGASWQQTSPPYRSRYMKGEVGHQGEFSDNGTTSFEYDARTNTISAHPDSSRAAFTNPIQQVRQELATGQAEGVGTTTIDGASVYKINLPHGLIGYFNASDYRPRYLDDRQSDGSVLRLRVAAYEYLPMTPSNQALLSVSAQHPGAPITNNPTGSSGK